MESACRAVRPFEQRPAYNPTDPTAFTKLQELRCVRSGNADLGPEIRLCSLCTEVALGESLLDETGDATEYKIVFYELPCGHLRCCSCALKWLDPAGIFHHICHFCDSQKRNINPDLTFILSTIDCQSEPDMSWVKGFYNGKPKKPAFPKASPKIELLPPIQEENKEVDLPSLDRETPVKKLAKEQRRVRLDTSVEVSGYSMPLPQLQWTPKAQRAEDGLESMHDDLPELDDEQNSYVMSAQVQKKHKLWSWANSPETALPDQSFEDWFEEEEKQQQPRKKLRLSF